MKRRRIRDDKYVIEKQNELAKQLKQAREEISISLNEWIKSSKLSYTQTKNVESGKGCNLASLIIFAKALGFDVKLIKIKENDNKN